MVVPTNTTVVLKITASDVIHSWWIPKLGGKADAVPGPHERDLVQDRQGGRLRGSVRRAVRLRPRRHARRGAGRVARALLGVPAPSAAGDLGPLSRASPSSAGSVRRGERPGPSRGRDARLPRAAARVAVVDHHDRPQEDRDHVPVRHLRLLHPGWRRGADHAPAAGHPGRNAGGPRDLQRPGLDARHHHGLPVRGAGARGLRQLLRAAHDRRARHGVPAPERAVALAARVRRRRVLRVDLLRAAAGRLDLLRARCRTTPICRAAAWTRGSS